MASSGSSDQLCMSASQGMSIEKKTMRPKAPDKPLLPYLRYSRKVWDEVKTANQGLKLWEIGKIIGQMWRDLPDGDQQEFVDEYETDMVEYASILKDYYNSQSYKDYFNARSKAHQGADVKESVGERFKKRKLDESSSVFEEVLVRKPIEDPTSQLTEEQNKKIIRKKCEGERERQGELTQELESAAAITSSKAEKEAAGTAAAAAPLKPMKLGVASSAVVNKDCKKRVVASSAALLKTKMEESITPAVNLETIRSFAAVPMETEDIKPTITEPIKVEDPRRQEPSAVNVLPPTPVNPVEATPVAPPLIESAPLVAPPIVKATPILETVSVIQTPVEAPPVVPVTSATFESLPVAPVVETPRQPAFPLPPTTEYVPHYSLDPEPASSHPTQETTSVEKIPFSTEPPLQFQSKSLHLLNQP